MAISTLHRGFDAGAFLPEDLAAALRRRVREIGGLALIGAAAIATAALASWSVKDPSLSYATGASVHNLLGTWGALAADLLMQLFGVAAVAILLPLAPFRRCAPRPSNTAPTATTSIRLHAN